MNEEPRGYYGQTALQAACIQGHKAGVELLPRAGADVHFCGGNNMQWTALQFAYGQGSEEIVAILLRHGAEVNLSHGIRYRRHSTAVTRYNGRSPLQAASEGHVDVIHLLAGAGAEQGGRCHGTALHAAAEGGQVGAIEALVELGPDIKAVSLRGWTPRQIASRKGQEKAVEVLRVLGG